MAELTIGQFIFFRIITPILATLVILLAAPFWKLVDGLNKLKNLCARNSPEIHARKVNLVQDQVLEWNRNGRKNKMCTGRATWKSVTFRKPTYKGTMTQIDVSMGDIIQLDVLSRTVTVEPMMTMGRLSNALIKEGWILPVVPEFTILTVGGLICGAGLETSSHKYGMFANTAVGFEIVVADGQVMNCTKDENAELFHAIPMSHGTLGFLTAVTLMIIPAKKYIKVEYIPVHSLDEAEAVFKSQTLRQSGNEYIEGIMFGLEKGVIMVGNMVSVADHTKVNSIGRWYKAWFYKHVESFLDKPTTVKYIEYIPLRQYLHRHDKGYFWEVLIPLPFANNVVFRYLLGWVYPIPLIFHKMSPAKAKNLLDNAHIVQDFVVPLEKMREHLLLSHDETEVYPIWLCPVKALSHPTSMMISNGSMFVDIGIYGLTHSKSYELEKSVKKLEAMCIKNSGFQGLYADVFLSREQFEIMFDHQLYFKMRKELNCEDAFPQIYDKVCRAARD